MTSVEEIAASARLNDLLAKAGCDALGTVELKLFNIYLSLLIRWNQKTNLTAIRNSDDILSRHFVECIACARALPSGIGTLLDLGSGAGLPGIPIAICRPDIEVTLAESQGKKAAFLREAVRSLSMKIKVHAMRAELLDSQFDCVILRAVDNMPEAVKIGASLTRSARWLALMTTEAKHMELQKITGQKVSWSDPINLPGGEQRILLWGQTNKKSPDA